jgi:hypothetical protein
MKTPLFAALVALTLVGCGPSQPSEARSSQAVSNQSDASADAWAEKAYAIYGKDAVQTCLAAFHASLSSDAPDTGAPGGYTGRASYRERLGDFMCACARGTSARACPEP